mmetsp:Transcript_17148/g.47485  ORF Transcript_17148/g.47485 Transcript_17148/m.47485 type:complete len:222 (+) Transcript_17148:41-706(+)
MQHDIIVHRVHHLRVILLDTVEEFHDVRRDLLLLQQEPVVSVQGVNDGELGIGHALDDLLLLWQWVEDVAVDAEDAGGDVHLGQDLLDGVGPAACDVVRVELLRELDVGDGIEAVDEFEALVLEVGLDLPVSVAAVGLAVLGLQLAPEFGDVAVRRPVRYHAQLARDLKSLGCLEPVRFPIGVREYRLPLHLGQRDLPRRVRCSACDGNEGSHERFSCDVP